MSKCDFNKVAEIVLWHSFMRIWSHLLKKYVMENFILCVVMFMFMSRSRSIYIVSVLSIFQFQFHFYYN